MSTAVSKDPFREARARHTDQDLGRYRLLFLMGALIYPLWWFVFDFALKNPVDSMTQRLAFAAMCLAVFALTYASAAVARNVHAFFITLAYVMTFHYFYLLHQNRMESHYVVALFVLVFAVASCFLSRRELFIYSVVVMITAAVLSTFHTTFSRTVFLVGLGTGLFVAYVALASRLVLFENLIESEERFRTMADTAPVMIWMSDENGFCNFFNEGWLKFTGKTLDDAVGNGWTKSLHPEDLNRYLEAFFAAFRARRDFQTEYRLQRGDGEYRRVFGRCIPLYQPNGVFSGYIGSVVDITDRRELPPAPSAETAPPKTAP
jgi:PAS domain S-box-containing protein